MNAESIIKGRTAGLIVNLMLQEAGYSVHRYGYEGAADALAQIGKLKKQKLLELLTSTPHFVVANEKDGSVFLIGVKFQGKERSGRNIPWGLGKMAEYWPGATLIVVRPAPPYFFMVVEDEKGIKQTPLKEAKILTVTDAQVKKYGLLARKFLV